MDKKIKVLRIIARLNIGGPAIHTVLLTEGLDKERFESLLVSGSIASDEGDMLYYAQKKGVEPYFVPELKRELSFKDDLKAFIKIYKIIRREKPDIIHTHTAKAGTLGRLAGILYNLSKLNFRRTRLIHTFHGHIFSGYFGRLKTRLFVFIERLLSLFSDKIVTVNSAVRDELVSLKIAHHKKIEIVPLGFELEEFLSVPSRPESDSLNIGIVGRLVPVKNHYLFLDMAVKTLKSNPQIQLRFRIIGDGALRGRLKEQARQLGISGQVEFLGWQKDLAAIYSDLDVVVLTSRNEGTPVSLIEAMACGRPVVATGVGGVPDLLGEAAGALRPQAEQAFRTLERGVLVARQCSDAFASALTHALRDSRLRSQIGMRAREFVRNQFSREKLVANIEKLYIDI